MTALKVLVDNKQRIQLKNIPDYKDFIKDTTIHIYANEGNGCRGCKHYGDRPSYCNGCENYTQYTPVKVTHTNKLGEHIAIDIGIDVSRLLHKEVTKIYGYKKPPFKNEYTFNTKLLYDYQKVAVKDILIALKNNQSGVLVSKPRTGKTVMAACIAIKFNTKTIIVAHQNDLLEQMYNTLLDEQANFTNCREYPNSVKICKTLKDFEDTDICLTTYQSIGNKPYLSKLANMFGLMIVDEIHKGGATWYSQVLSVFKCPRLGLTGTDNRKDGKYTVVKSIIGEALHNTPAKSMIPTVSTIDLPFKSNRNIKVFSTFSKTIEKDLPSQNRILTFIRNDIQKGYNILIPVYHKEYASKLSKWLTKRKIGNIIISGDFKDTKTVKRRTDLLNKARYDKDIKVTIAIRSLLTGVNVPRWSMIYEIYPISNKWNFIQEYQRICTPMPNKNNPVIRYFLPEWEMYLRCFKNMAKVLKDEDAIFTKTADEKLLSVLVRYGNQADLKKYYPAYAKGTNKNNTVKAKRRFIPLTNILGEALDIDESKIQSVEDFVKDNYDTETEINKILRNTTVTKKATNLGSLNDYEW